MHRPSQPPVPTPTAAPAQQPERLIDSNSLFQGRRVLVIRHEGADYRLLITRQGKLLLNK